MRTVHGGRTLYGHVLGVIVLDTSFPRVVGDVGNAGTWPFPVMYRVIRGAVSKRIVSSVPDESLLGEAISAARDLEAEGVKAITTSCGFFSVFQRELAAAVAVPVLTSALMQVPLVAAAIGAGRRVGILTERPGLTNRHFLGAGWSEADVGVRIGTLAPDAVFPSVFIDGATDADVDVLEREVVEAGQALVAEYPDVGAIVCECTNFVPFSCAVRRHTGLPVFDLYTLVMQAYEAVVGTQFGLGSGQWG